MATKITDTKLVAPSVHSNGSGYDLLREQYEGALKALKAAQEALPRPHRRDYYPQGDTVYVVAREQYRGQLAKLDEVSKELRAIFCEVIRQKRGAA